MPPPLTLIAAIARNGVIGKGNALPWHLPEDLRRFKALTTGQAVIMGRKTWDSLPAKFRPLPNRLNIVVTRNRDYRAEGATVVGSLDAAIHASQTLTPFVIGGAELYAHALPLAQRLELTEIDADIEGDAHFPHWDRRPWREAARETHRAEAGWNYSFVSYERV
ncbi:MAG: dihydrofolate reductase [Rhodocyclaceae bacterium]|nr:dihydrofolate reductase [Rhodocyclaceae bacterium]MBK6554124.1 dihydrofolate reductase [Rhodocyclaceae bacterium]MBK9310593.1 dihydrofolate reductase [Rhodocyclaceae bacterium]MBK9954336.1 dihydrofolate reductase [Rhodocyclaceae bacterium]